MGYRYKVFNGYIRMNKKDYIKHKETIDKLCDDEITYDMGYPIFEFTEVGRYDYLIKYLRNILNEFKKLNIRIIDDKENYTVVGEDGDCSIIKRNGYNIKIYEIDSANMRFIKIKSY